MTENNLTSKFNALEDTISSNHNVQLAALAAMSAMLFTQLTETKTLLSNNHSEMMQKMDAIIAALGGAPPAPTATLQDVVNAINTLNATTGDVHADTMSIDAKLLRVRDAIAPIDEPFPGGDRSSILWLLYRLVDAINPVWPRPTSIPVQPALNQVLDALIPEISNLLSTSQSIRTVLGPSGLSTTVLAELISIHECVCDDKSPDPTDPNACAEPYVSTQIQAAAARNFAVFVSPPSAIEIIDDQAETGVPVGAKIRPTSQNWTGYSIYVASRAAKLYADDEVSLERYSTNVWREMSPGNYMIAPNVGPNDDIVVYVCLPGGVTPPADECYDMDSQIITVDAGAYHHVRYGPIFPISFQLTTQFPFGEFWTHSPLSIAVGNFNGWTVELLEGNRIRAYTASSSNFVDILTITTVGGKATFTNDCEFMTIDNYQSNEITPGTPFRVRLCAPEPA